MAKKKETESKVISREERVTGKRPVEELVKTDKDSRESRVKGD